jgi:hypothetical protein
MWYFQYNNRSNGPNDQAVIEALIIKNTISRDTFVWKDGMKDWCRLADTELMALLPKNLPPPMGPTAISIETASPPPFPQALRDPPGLSPNNPPVNSFTNIHEIPRDIRSDRAQLSGP